jgi:adenylate kinase
MGLNVVMMGPPGAGKGTQAGRFARDRGLPIISTGDILREAVRDRTPGGAAAKAQMERGGLVDDETMIAIVRERLSRADTHRGFVLDGFPRTVAQARALDQIMSERGKGALIVVDVDVPEAELVKRLAHRLICSSCGRNADPSRSTGKCSNCGGRLVQRADDNEQVVLERLKVYATSTKPVLEYYRGRPTFRVVNGAQSPEQVARDLDAMIEDAVAERTSQ